MLFQAVMKFLSRLVLKRASFSSRIAFISQYIKYELNKSKLGYFSTLLQENEGETPRK
jgi:hypothetical protein